MLGLMMDRQLLVSSVIEYAARQFPDQEVVSRNADGSIHRYTYRDVQARAKQLANALLAWGVTAGDRIATLAWNNHRHVELYYGISGIGAVCHTINPRLQDEQIAYIANHSGARIMFFDLSQIEQVRAVAPSLPKVEAYVALCDAGDLPVIDFPRLEAYESWLDAQATVFEWPALNENAAAVICYTSGTTGNPKGVVYSHRAQLLHSMATIAPNAFGLSAQDVVMPVVPMFHISCWGLVYSAPMVGAKLVLPGQQLDGASLAQLIRDEGVTFSAGVPTVWMGLLKEIEANGGTTGKLQRVFSGGSAVPVVLMQQFDAFGVEILQGWGMTETTVGLVGRLKPSMATASKDSHYALRAAQGFPVFGFEMRIVDEGGSLLPEDGDAVGEVQIRGLWTVDRYYLSDSPSTTPDGWLPTGDAASISPQGYMRITDRIKDLIKSGGEWISSIDLENTVMGHPGVAQAAVVGVPHERWGERPALFIVPRPGIALGKDEIQSFLRSRVARWWIPEHVTLVEQLPLGPTGKVLKRQLRQQLVSLSPPND